jgi:predicted AAA+ superfamily ATPase
MRRPGKVYVGKVGTAEVDFVVEDAAGDTYIQVAANVDSPRTLERELAPLRAVPSYGPRLGSLGRRTGLGSSKAP